jgi:hypothetical protein
MSGASGIVQSSNPYLSKVPLSFLFRRMYALAAPFRVIKARVAAFFLLFAEETAAIVYRAGTRPGTTEYLALWVAGNLPKDCPAAQQFLAHAQSGVTPSMRRAR